MFALFKYAEHNAYFPSRIMQGWEFLTAMFRQDRVFLGRSWVIRLSWINLQLQGWTGKPLEIVGAAGSALQFRFPPVLTKPFRWHSYDTTYVSVRFVQCMCIHQSRVCWRPSTSGTTELACNSKNCPISLNEDIVCSVHSTVAIWQQTPLTELYSNSYIDFSWRSITTFLRITRLGRWRNISNPQYTTTMLEVPSLKV